MRSLCLTMAAGLGLAACGGGETAQQRVSAAPIQLVPEQIRDDNAPEVSRLLGDRRQLLIDAGLSSSKTEQLQRNTSHDVPGFQAFGMVSNTNLLLWQSEGASGKAELSRYLDTSYIPSPLGANAETFYGTAPTTGKATYDGNYVGFQTANYGSILYGAPTQHYMTGKVTLAADFGAGTVSGAITNRQRHRLSDRVFLGAPTDITLQPITLVNGRAAAEGSTIGGEYNSASFNDQPVGGTHSGTWSLAFGGTEAAEAFGRIQVDHDIDQSVQYSDPNDYTEVGVFEATKQ